MDIRPIKNEKDYDSALTLIDKLFEAKPGSKQADKLEILVTLPGGSSNWATHGHFKTGH